MSSDWKIYKRGNVYKIGRPRRWLGIKWHWEYPEYPFQTDSLDYAKQELEIVLRREREWQEFKGSEWTPIEK